MTRHLMPTVLARADGVERGRRRERGAEQQCNITKDPDFQLWCRDGLSIVI